MKTLSDLKMLLLQIRDDRETMMEELYEFIQFSGLQEQQFTVLNTFITKDFDVSVIDGFDALFIGGSSDASVLKPEEFVFLTDCKQLLRRCYRDDIPVFASCFGFQLLVQEFGGEVIVDAERMEMGTYEIQMLEEAKKDILCHDLPSSFWAVSGHKERALTIPKNAVAFGYTPLCPYHIIKMKDKPMYGFQFHPEIDTKDLIARLSRYQTLYLKDAETFEKIKREAHPDTRYANGLVRKFVERVVCDKPQ